MSCRPGALRRGSAGAVLLAMVAISAGCTQPTGSPALAEARPVELARTAEPAAPADLRALLEARRFPVQPGDAPRTEAEPYDRSPLARGGAAGRLDPTFGTRGVTVTRVAGHPREANNLVVLKDGSIVTVGGGRRAGSDFVLVKYRCDGTVDTRFGTRGQVVTPLAEGGSGAQAVAVAPKGRLVVVGTAGLGQPNQSGFAVARYLPDGRLDPGFGTGGVVVAPIGPQRSAGASDVVVLPDGRILVAGGATDAQGNPGFAAARFLPNGRLDPGFGTGGSVIVPMPGGDAAGLALALQPKGRIVLGGTAENQGVTYFGLARLTPNGQLDRSFGNQGTTLAAFPDANINGLHDLAVDRAGRIVAVGVTGTDHPPFQFGLMRFRPDGALDPTFGGGTGMVRTAFEGTAAATGVLLRPDGRIIAVGQAWPNIALAGYLPNGDLDDRFGDHGLTITRVGQISAASAVALQFGKRLVISGVTGDASLSDAAFLVARYGLAKGPLPACCERTPTVVGLG
ncbi:hypothetical protein K7640_10120 [Micromonospora sp. PLK6-60]|uniref:hypothetical protein n=1 Tax=Micromonospora sp. PLK6-60 TaxID=2873383 RepID=UPI001CA66139|nr:hypothetical protein [Micromonospora sp. PLK6-60]MBY8872195.1 hypothetical protein [Micromonospora sp. PLK6-60]